MSDLFVKLDRVKVSLAALRIAADMDDYMRMIVLFVDDFEGLSPGECVAAVKEACEIWQSSRK